MKESFKFLFALFLGHLIVSCAGIQTIDENSRLHQVFDNQWEWQMKNYPEWSTYQGRTEYNYRWTDRSKQARAYRDEHMAGYLVELEKIDRAKLSAENQMYLDIALDETRRSLKSQEFPSEYLVISQLHGVQNSIGRVFSVMPKQRPSDFDDIFSRMEKLPVVINQLMELMREGMERGVTPPKKTLRSVPEQLASLTVEDFQTNPLMTSFQNIPSDWDEDQRQHVKKKLKELFDQEVLPAFRTFALFFNDVYLPNTRETTAMSALPKGKEWYSFAVEGHTTTDLSPEQIHQIGLEEVRRIRNEMRALVEEAKFDGSLVEFIDYLLSDEKFYFSQGEDLLREYRAICKKIDGRVAKLFHTLPRTPYGVEKVASHMAESSPAALYQGGNLQSGRSGTFYVNTSNLESRPKWEMEALALHEAVPGHHLQIALAQEMENVPEFRRGGRYTAFVEGWALYAEALGLELDLYNDPYSDFGRLSFEMWRAIRLVVDTGLHALNWSRDEAIDFFVQNSGRPKSEAMVEVDRYIVWPGQALSYKLGELKIWELRSYAEEKLGDNFDVREFHHQVLRHGAIPLNLLEENIKSWVKDLASKV